MIRVINNHNGEVISEQFNIPQHIDELSNKVARENIDPHDKYNINHLNNKWYQ